MRGANGTLNRTPLPVVDGQPTHKASAQVTCPLELDRSGRRVRLASGTRIDLGGIAKGWIAESAARVLSQYAGVCAVNAGGDLFTIGIPAGETVWDVALEDPRDPQATLVTLHVGPGAVTTSYITKRSWVKDGQRQHHLIDPRTGQPAQTGWLSVTVIAPRASVAETYAKAILIAGSGEAMALAGRRKDVEFIAVEGQGQLWSSGGAKRYLDIKGG